MRGGGSETLPGKGSCRVAESLGHFDAGKEHSNASLRRFVGLDSCPASAIVRNALAFGPQQRRDDAAADRLFLLPRAFLSPRSLFMDTCLFIFIPRASACGGVARDRLSCLCENEVQPLERNKRGGGVACEREREKRRSTESRCGRGSSLYFCLALWRWARMP